MKFEQTQHNPAWRGVIVMLGLALVSITYLAMLEFGPKGATAIQDDELFFSACAARGLAVGQLPVAGCHDNKGPVIFVVHQVVQLISTPYNVPAIKVTAFLVVFLLAIAVGAIAHRLGGGVAGVGSAALILQALATNSTHLALKTETVGVVFILMSVMVLMTYSTRQAPWRVFISGALMGLAVLTKQTNLLLAAVVALWLILATHGTALMRIRSAAIAVSLFSVGVASPFFLFFLIYFLDNRHVEFLANFFVYPAVYGSASDASLFKKMIWAAGPVLTSLAAKPLLSTLFVLGSARTVIGYFSETVGSRSKATPQLLILLIVVAMLLGILVSPTFYSYHIVPVQIPMAVLAGLCIAEMGRAVQDFLFKNTGFMTAGLVIPSVLMAVSTWYGHNGKEHSQTALPNDAKLVGGRGEYAYVLGTWPGFYVYNGFSPASNVMFPWALPGAPRNGIYQPPPEDSVRGLMLGWAQRHGLEDLRSDFRRTPPRFIVVMHQMARSENSEHIADVPGFDQYLHDYCNHLRELQTSHGRLGSLFQCNSGLLQQQVHGLR